jgi:hypothetical protein
LATADEEERLVLVYELVKCITVLPDHLEVKVTGASVLNVLYGKAGFKVLHIVGVGDSACAAPDWRIVNWDIDSRAVVRKEFIFHAATTHVGLC